jgi:DAK2 domain fusion protein YloV
MVLEVLDAGAVRRWTRAAVDILDVHRAEIDALNVFPVPDGDTGRNMLLTLRAAAERLPEPGGGGDDGDDGDEAPAEALRALSSGAAFGAIGNSGFLLSQVLRGLAEAASGGDRCDATVVATGLGEGARLARAAVMTPVEGTMLSVCRAAAEAAATAAKDGAALHGTLSAAVAAADAALAATPDQLAELAEAGVVDAGGRGLLLVLAALCSVVGGAMPELAEIRIPELPAARTEPGAATFEVQYLLDAREPAVHRLQERLTAIGESVAVVGAGPDAWKVHVHVDDAGAAIEAGLAAGPVHRITVVRLGERDGRDTVEGAAAAGPARVVVAIAPGDGVASLFEGEGTRVVAVTAGLPPSAERITVAVPTDAREVVLLPVPDAVADAEAAAAALRARGRRVSVVPVRSPVQGLAAVAVHDTARRFDDDVVAMAEAAAATRFAEVCVADAAALTAVGMCRAGDVLGLIDGEVVQLGQDVATVAAELLDRLLAIGAELVTVLVGEDAPPDTAAVLERRVRERAPLTDVATYPVGRLDHLVVIGAE